MALVTFYLIWLLELALELAGAHLSLKRRCWPVLSLFSFLAASDVLLLALQFFHASLYAWASWIQRAGKYALLCYLACWLCGKFVRAEKATEVRLAALIFTMLGTALVLKVFSDGVTLSDRLMDAENSANAFLAALVAVGWISRSSYLKAPWTWIAAGLLIAIGTDFAVTALWMKWDSAAVLYPFGAIPSYGTFIWAMRKEPEAEQVVRLSLQAKTPVTGWICEEYEDERMEMWN